MYRCPACRTRKASWALIQHHMRATGHRLCNCGGYHHPHRIGSGCCYANPDYRLHQARRAGHVAEPCPF